MVAADLKEKAMDYFTIVNFPLQYGKINFSGLCNGLNFPRKAQNARLEFKLPAVLILFMDKFILLKTYS
ncbi:MAG: hypothetical protein K6G18_08580 [Treponema sp.]|nr:hypothetical protein [Treponema sp.]